MGPAGTGYGIDAGQYASFAEAVTAAAGTTLIVSTRQDVAPGQVVPADVSLKVVHGGLIETTSGLLSIDGPFDAPPVRIFAGDGSVRLAAGAVLAVYPEWWQDPSATTWTAAIQASIDAAPDSIPVILQPVTYLVAASTSEPLVGSSAYHALTVKSHMYLKGTKGSTIIKMMDGQSTDAAPKNINILWGSGQYVDHRIEGIIFDMNGDRNKIGHRRLQSTSYIITSTSNIDDDIAHIAHVDGLTISECEFRNTAGTNQIITSLRKNGTGGMLSRNVRIYRNRFYNNGLDTADYTSIYCLAENAWVEENVFEQPDSLSRSGNNWVAFEVHGKNTWFNNNSVYGYYRGCWVASNFADPVTDVYVSQNVFSVWGLGPSIFRPTSLMSPVDRIHITDNFIEIDDTPVAGLTKSAIEIAPAYSVSDIEIARNHYVSNSTLQPSVFALITGSTSQDAGHPATDAELIRDIRIVDNYAEGSTHGELVRTFANRANITDIASTGNTYRNLRVPSAGSTIAVGTYLLNRTGTDAVQVMTRVTVRGNTYVSADSPSRFSQGIRLENSFGDLFIDGNQFSNLVTVSPAGTRLSIVKPNTTASSLLGRDVMVAAATPTTGVWSLADRVTNIAPASGEPNGWVCTMPGGAYSTTRADSTAYAFGTWAHWSSGTSVWMCVAGGTSETAAPSITGAEVGDTVADGTVIWKLMSLIDATFADEA